MLPQYMMVIGGWVLFKKDRNVCPMYNSCRLKNQILTSFGLREMTAAGLRITMFCLSYTHSTETGQT
jgi:hypothetical protein